MVRHCIHQPIEIEILNYVFAILVKMYVECVIILKMEMLLLYFMEIYIE